MLLRTKNVGGGRNEIYIKQKSNNGSLNQLLPRTPGLSCFSGGHTASAASRPLFSIYTLIHLTPGVGPQIPYPPDNNGDHIFLSH
jgi:hypothetical protein